MDREIMVKGFQFELGGNDYQILYILGGKQWAASSEGLAFGWNSSAGDFEETEELSLEKIEVALNEIQEMVVRDEGRWAPVREGSEAWDIVISWL